MKKTHKGRSNRPAAPRGVAPHPKSGKRATGPAKPGPSRRATSATPAPQKASHFSPLSPLKKDSFFLFGRHAVEAALKNTQRECLRLIGLEKALGPDIIGIRPGLRVEKVDDEAVLRATVPGDSPHQGILLEVRPLPGVDLASLTPLNGRKNIILMLDQVTDPHNVGACIRTAAAFGARAIITQDRNSPNESGTLARASSGGLEILPWVQVTNLNQALGNLREMGYWHIGLDGHTDTSVRGVTLGDNLVIVMGSEGKGLRPLVRSQCDAIVKIPMSGNVESLNVSVAAAIALYELGSG